MTHEALDGLLKYLPVDATVFCRAELSAPWGVFSEQTPFAVFHALVRGGGLLWLGDEAPLPLAEGDLLLLPRGTRHEMASDAGADKVALQSLPPIDDGQLVGCVKHGGEGAPTSLLCGKLCFEPHAANTIVDLLPPLIHLRRDASGLLEWVDGTLRLLAREVEQNIAGASTIVAKLSELLFAQMLRAHVLSLPEGAGGWLGAMRHDKIAAAMALIHNEPGAAWTADDLASRVGMSRSAFFSRFSELVGEPPARYLTRWRMFRACQRLRSSGVSLIELAEHTGYSSEGAFSKAFKRIVGLTPSQYREQQT